jgi:hypothetical protein
MSNNSWTIPIRIGSMVTHFQLPAYEFHWATRKARDIAISANSLGTWFFSKEQLCASTECLLEIIPHRTEYRGDDCLPVLQTTSRSHHHATPASKITVYKCTLLNTYLWNKNQKEWHWPPNILIFLKSSLKYSCHLSCVNCVAVKSENKQYSYIYRVVWRAENPGVVCERICHLCIVINPPIVICNKISLLLSLLVFTLFIRV